MDRFCNIVERSDLDRFLIFHHTRKLYDSWKCIKAKNILLSRACHTEFRIFIDLRYHSLGTLFYTSRQCYTYIQRCSSNHVPRGNITCSMICPSKVTSSVLWYNGSVLFGTEIAYILFSWYLEILSLHSYIGTHCSMFNVHLRVGL